MIKNKTFSVFLVIVACFFLFTSCSVQKKITVNADDVVIYPAPPDTARIQYLTGINNSRDVTDEQSAFATFISGKKPAIPIVKPYGIFLHKGRLYICDGGANDIVILDFKKHKFTRLNSKGLGKLRYPINIFVDDTDLIYVADVKRKQIVIYDLKGKYIDAIGEEAKFKPTDVYVYGDKIWVANVKNNEIKVYDRNTHELMFSFPDSEQGNDDYLYSPTNLYVSKDRVYVSDMGGGNVKYYTHEGKFIGSLGSYGRGVGQFVRPKGVAVDKKSNLYVVDSGFENVQIFNKDSQYLMFFGGPYKGPGDLWLPTVITIDYDNLKYFEKYVDNRYNLKYLILVSNLFGPSKINVYGHIEAKK